MTRYEVVVDPVLGTMYFWIDESTLDENGDPIIIELTEQEYNDAINSGNN